MSLFYNTDPIAPATDPALNSEFTAPFPMVMLELAKTPNEWITENFILFRFQQATFTTTFSGSGLTYGTSATGAVVMTGGTISTIVSESESSLSLPPSYARHSLSISGGSYDAATIQSFITAGDEPGYWDYLTAGDDVFVVASGEDIVRAGAGNDAVYVNGTGDKTIYGGTGSNAIYATAGNDLIVSGSLTAATLDPSLWSVADGGAGNDVLLAGYGSNGFLTGGAGHDALVDGAGTDVLNGGAGFDYMVAGTGTNYFMFESDSFVAGEYDAIASFTSANNFAGIAAAYAGAMTTGQYGTTAGLHFALGGGQYYSIYFYDTALADVTSHLFYI
ncbi:MAG: calcium-binding protein [Rhizobiaceae bacterium]